jgi:ribosomal protein L30/L7E
MSASFEKPEAKRPKSPRGHQGRGIGGEPKIGTDLILVIRRKSVIGTHRRKENEARMKALGFSKRRRAVALDDTPSIWGNVREAYKRGLVAVVAVPLPRRGDEPGWVTDFKAQVAGVRKPGSEPIGQVGSVETAVRGRARRARLTLDAFASRMSVPPSGQVLEQLKQRLLNVAIVEELGIPGASRLSPATLRRALVPTMLVGSTDDRSLAASLLYGVGAPSRWSRSERTGERRDADAFRASVAEALRREGVSHVLSARIVGKEGGMELTVTVSRTLVLDGSPVPLDAASRPIAGQLVVAVGPATDLVHTEAVALPGGQESISVKFPIERPSETSRWLAVELVGRNGVTAATTLDFTNVTQVG